MEVAEIRIHKIALNAFNGFQTQLFKTAAFRIGASVAFKSFLVRFDLCICKQNEFASTQ